MFINIRDFLLPGIENATTAKDLCKILNVDGRTLTQLIERERREGAPICASCGAPFGYYLAADQEEMQDYCGRLRHRLQEISATMAACEMSIDRLPMRGGGGIE